MKKFLIAASTAVGMSAIATAPSFAYTITGSGDAWLYDNNYNSCGPNSTCLTNDTSRLNAILGGNSSAPGGNVELFATSETVSLANFQTSGRTSIEGTVAGKSLTLSSLTYSDWFSTGSGVTTLYGANNLANKWFNAFYKAAGLEDTLGLSARGIAYNAYLGDNVKGFQRSSDPNISYITTSGSDLLIGLAGHYNAKEYYAPMLGAFGSLIKNGFQVSEVVKVNYGGVEDFLY
ncbi:MAG: NF038130 family PEP-CTERM protein, partial [Phormidium sp.]